MERPAKSSKSSSLEMNSGSEISETARTTTRSKSLSFIDGYTSRNSSYSFANDYVELQTIDTDLSEFPTTRDSSLTDITFSSNPDKSIDDFVLSKLPPPHESLKNDKNAWSQDNTSFPPPDPSLYDSGIAEINYDRKREEQPKTVNADDSSCPSNTKISDSSVYYTGSETSLDNKENQNKTERFYKLCYDPNERTETRGKKYYR